MADFQIVSEDFFNRNQSWCYAGIFRNRDATVRVDVRANAYEEQSEAKVSVWGSDGWAFFASLPTAEWYADAPRYVKRELTVEDEDVYRFVRNLLLDRLAIGLWNNPGARFVASCTCVGRNPTSSAECPVHS